MSDRIRLMVGPEQLDNSHFGVLMRLLRNEAQLSRADAASTVGLSSEFLRLIEQGKRTPSAGMTRVILQEYGVPFDVCTEDDKYVLIFREHEVKFTSRIQEARKKTVTPTNASRNEVIVRIVSLLPIADKEKLNNVLDLLKGD